MQTIPETISTNESVAASTDWVSRGVMQDVLVPLGIMASAVIIALGVHYVLFRVLEELGKRLGFASVKSMTERTHTPMRVLLPLLAIQLTLPGLNMRPRFEIMLTHVVSLLLIGCITWLLVRVVRIADDVAASRYPTNVPDNRRARRIATLVQIMRQIVVVVLVIIGGAVMLMTFPQARQFGVSVLASAGIAGIVVGMASRPALSNIIAGVQVALTEPIALDDVVIVEGEYGNVEEITTSYVVIRCWDLRRLIVPLSYFMEKPFQNWTRMSSDLLGTVLLHVDFTVPVEAIRQELGRILDADPRWDQKVRNVQITNAIDERLEVRLMMSAASAPKLWDLRCAVREQMIGFLREKYPDALFKTRVEVVPSSADNLSNQSLSAEMVKTAALSVATRS